MATCSCYRERPIYTGCELLQNAKLDPGRGMVFLKYQSAIVYLLIFNNSGENGTFEHMAVDFCLCPLGYADLQGLDNG